MEKQYLIGIISSLPYGPGKDYKKIDSSYVIDIGVEELGEKMIKFGISSMVEDIAKNMKVRKVSGLVVTQGHGDINAIKNLEGHFEGSLPEIPIFEAHKLPDNVHEEYRIWLNENFRRS